MIDATLNYKIKKLAPKFSASDFAPDTFEKLRSNSVSGLVVWAGASDSTIYGDPSVNHAFRAWHDSLHLKLNAPFTLEGERLVAIEQARLVGSDTMGNILIGEIVGQAEYFAKHGEFPANQVEFMLNWLKGRI
jgi:hypothetical protein